MDDVIFDTTIFVIKKNTFGVKFYFCLGPTVFLCNGIYIGSGVLDLGV